MGIKTSDFVPNLPPKDFESLTQGTQGTSEEVSIGIDWLGILDSFDPTKLDQRFLNECARRNPHDTCYRWDMPTGNTHTGNMPPIPPTPIASRLKSLEREQERSSGNSPLKSIYRRQLEECVKRIETEGLKRGNYNTARTLLIQLIGMKGALEYVRREYERLGEAGRKKQYEEYIAWERKREAEEQRREAELEAEEQEWEEELEKAEETGDYSYFKDKDYLYEPKPASVHEKIVTIRKGILASNGKPLKQRDFAKLIGYPISKYVEAEKVDQYRPRYQYNQYKYNPHNQYNQYNPHNHHDGEYDSGCEYESPVEIELLDKLVMIAHANPYWLFDPESEADDASYSIDNAVLVGDQPCVYATVDVILHWIEEGKPRETSWEDGIALFAEGAEEFAENAGRRKKGHFMVTHFMS